jgi:hypothetical protein
VRLSLTYMLRLDVGPFLTLRSANWDRLPAACPMEMRVHETDARIEFDEHLSPEDGIFVLHVSCSVADPATITTGPGPFDDHMDSKQAKPMPIVICPELDLLEMRAEEISGALALLCGAPVDCGPYLGGSRTMNRLFADSARDTELIKHLGRAWVVPPMRAVADDPALERGALTDDLIARVAETPGILGYFEAAHAQSAVAEFRELWRTLELAFGAQGRKLPPLIAAHPAARELGFDLAELTHYSVLRGKASHGSDRAGHLEAARIHRSVHQRVGRLHALVERVLAGAHVPFPEDQEPTGFNRPLDDEPPRAGR